jgi:hypothetical protein
MTFDVGTEPLPIEFSSCRYCTQGKADIRLEMKRSNLHQAGTLDMAAGQAGIKQSAQFNIPIP